MLGIIWHICACSAKTWSQNVHSNKELCLWVYRGVIIQIILSSIPDFTVLVFFLVSLLGDSGLAESTGYCQFETRRVTKLPALPFPLGRSTLLFSFLEPLQRPRDMTLYGWSAHPGSWSPVQRKNGFGFTFKNDRIFTLTLFFSLLHLWTLTFKKMSLI